MHLHQIYRHFDLLVDSRRLLDPGRTLFFALPGRRVDGHAYVAELYGRGVRHFVVLRRPEGEFPAAVFHQVADVTAALQDLAIRRRKEITTAAVVGITGSNGKTMVKEWLYRLLENWTPTVRSPRSYNSRIGVPLSVWQLRPEHRIGIFEAGIDRTGEMDLLAAVIQPTHGILTSLGEAHRAGFASEEEKLAEKLRLFSGCTQTLVPARVAVAYPRLMYSLNGRQTFGPAGEVAADWTYERTATDELLLIDPQKIAMAFALPYRSSIDDYNAALALAAARWLGAPPAVLHRQLPRLTPLGNRLEVMQARGGGLLINDSYSNDLTSLAAALEFARERDATGRLNLLLSDLPQTALPAPELYRQVARLLATHRVDQVLAVGPEIGELLRQVGPDIRVDHLPDPAALAEHLTAHPLPPAALTVVKGAREFAFERTLGSLRRMTHRAELAVDLSALADNLYAHQRMLPAGTQLYALVKAGAYGTGGPTLARFLRSRGVAGLIVAYPDEGVELREAGIDGPIMVLNAEPDDFPRLLEYELEPEIFASHQLDYLHQLKRPARPLRIHLKFDTGMHRLGFPAAEAAAVGRNLRELAGSGRITAASVFTHLAAAEEEQQDAFTRQQFSTFDALYAVFTAALGAAVPRHVLNSAGIA
ncbi:MAG: alanine racemase, partial [Saprospiraceae bacterium]